MLGLTTNENTVLWLLPSNLRRKSWKENHPWMRLLHNHNDGRLVVWAEMRWVTSWSMKVSWVIFKARPWGDLHPTSLTNSISSLMVQIAYVPANILLMKLIQVTFFLFWTLDSWYSHRETENPISSSISCSLFTRRSSAWQSFMNMLPSWSLPTSSPLHWSLLIKLKQINPTISLTRSIQREFQFFPSLKVPTCSSPASAFSQ